MRARLTTVLAVCFGLSGIILTAILAGAAGIEASASMTGLVRRELRQASLQAAERIDRFLYERWSDMTILSQELGTLEKASHRREAIKRIESSRASYLWVGFADTDCRITMTTDGRFEGESVASRRWCQEGKNHPFAGDSRVLPLLSRNGPDVRGIDIAMPVHNREGKLLGVVAAHIATDVFYSFQRSSNPEIAEGHPTESFVINQSGRIVAGPKDLVENVIAGQLYDQVVDPNADINARWPDGSNYISGSAATHGFGSFPGMGWYVVTRADKADALTVAKDVRERIIMWGSGIILANIAMAYLLARWLGDPLHDLARRAIQNRPMLDGTSGRYRELNELALILDQRFAALNTSVADLEVANGRIKEALADKETLLREVHHRVKNNLQVIISTMRLQGSRARDNPSGQALVARITDRVQVLGWLYSKLYERAIFENIEAKSLIEPLMSVIADTYRPNSHIDISIDHVTIGFDQTLVLGMLAIETVTNAVQHGRGRIVVRLKATPDGEYEFVVIDEGEGFDPNKRYQGVGLTLSQRMAQQLGGSLDVKSDEQGTRVKVQFEIERHGGTTMPGEARAVAA